jgi:hypothetical protein
VKTSNLTYAYFIVIQYSCLVILTHVKQRQLKTLHVKNTGKEKWASDATSTDMGDLVLGASALFEEFN